MSRSRSGLVRGAVASLVLLGAAPDARGAASGGAPAADRDVGGCCAPAKDASVPDGTAPGAWTQSPFVGRLAFIPAGTFLMGSPPGEPGRDADEAQHGVTLTRGFLLMEHEVTQAQWQAVMGSNPSENQPCPDCPVEQVTWHEAVEFARNITALEGGGVEYRLPTEAEWERAARGGQSHPYSGSEDLDAVGWHDGNSGGQTHPGCRKARNGYGLCDMSGNVREWVADGYGAYSTGPVTDPTGPAIDPTGFPSHLRVSRDGSWRYDPAASRVAERGTVDPGHRSGQLGFRLARTVPPPPSP